jgi:hypothetical protein
MDELKKLFEELPDLNGVELINRQHEAEHVERTAHAKVEIIKHALAWREAERGSK